MNKFNLPFDLPFKKVKYYVNMAGVVLVAWISAGIASSAIASLVAPPPTLGASKGENRFEQRSRQDLIGARQSRREYDVIVSRNIFDSENRINKRQTEETAAIPKAVVEEDMSDAPPIPSTLPYKLVGTVVSTNQRFSLATLEPKARGESEQFRVGDQIDGKATVTSIERNKVFIRNRGRLEYFETDENKKAAISTPGITEPASQGDMESGGVKEVAPGKFMVDKGRIENVMANMSQVMTQARVVPHFENGRAAGWKIFAIKPNSIYQELDLRNGDIIQRINGMEIDNPAKALEMYQQLASETNISIDLMRRGKKESFQYEIR